jgi:hypothetical protein
MKGASWVGQPGAMGLTEGHSENFAVGDSLQDPKRLPSLARERNAARNSTLDITRNFKFPKKDAVKVGNFWQDRF